MGRAPCCEKAGLKRGRWTAEEDDILTKYIQANGEGKWRSLPKNAGLLRCGKSCRLRWVNYLKSDLKRGNFSTDEDETIIKLHSSLGKRWCLIASHLPGRTDNEIKNYWNSHLSRKIYNYRKIIKELKQKVVVDQPPKLGSTDIAPRTLVGRTGTGSAIKKKKSKFPTTLPNPTRENLVEKSREATTSSQQVDNGGDAIVMPSRPALEEDVMSSMLQSETVDDIFLDYDFSNMVFVGLEAGPAEVPNLNGEILFTNDEVENWLTGGNTTQQLESELNISSNAENGDPPSFDPNDDDLDNLGWEYWDDLDFVDGDVQGEKLCDSTEEEKLLSGLWEISSGKDVDGDCISTKLQSESDRDKLNEVVEWLLSSI